MLPPFFTLQPVAGTLCRQQKLWADLILDHAAWASAEPLPNVSSILRLYTPTCALFHNPSLGMRMDASSAKAMLEGIADAHPTQCALIDDGLLVACVSGGLAAVEQSLLAWLLEEGGATTSTDLSKNGVVMTFDELVEAKCLAHKLMEKAQRAAGACDVPVIISSDPAGRFVGALSEEAAIRSLLAALQGRAVSILRPFKITQFNLDGSTSEPFQGVKFGGQ
jgi:ESCRT-II complex subunit VPS25